MVSFALSPEIPADLGLLSPLRHDTISYQLREHVYVRSFSPPGLSGAIESLRVEGASQRAVETYRIYALASQLSTSLGLGVHEERLNLLPGVLEGLQVVARL